MRHVATLLTALVALAAAPIASAADMAGADIVNTDGEVIGKAAFEQTPTGVLISVDVTGLPPGGHGIHLHAVGACTPNFKAATGHINPDKVKHGLRKPRRAGQRRSAQSVRRGRWNGQGGVLHHPCLRLRGRHARAARRGRLDGHHPRASRRSHEPTHRRRRWTHCLRHHRKTIASAIAGRLSTGCGRLDQASGRDRQARGTIRLSDCARRNRMTLVPIETPAIGSTTRRPSPRPSAEC